MAAAYLQRRLPSFWKPDPELWFTQAEAIFATAGITSQHTRFHHTIAVLDIDVLSQVSDLVKKPGITPYDTLKKRLVDAFSDSEFQRITKLLEDTRLGNQKPSWLLRSMQQQAGTVVSEEMVKTLWLRNLPSRVQGILTVSGQKDLSKLAETADKIMEVDKPPEHYAVRTSSNHDDLAKKVEQLTTELEKLRRGRSLSRDRGENRSPYRRSRSRSKTPNRRNYRLCYYHWRFREKANKCEQPCSWDPKKHNTDTDNLNTEK